MFALLFEAYISVHTLQYWLDNPPFMDITSNGAIYTPRDFILDSEGGKLQEKEILHSFGLIKSVFQP